MKVTIADIVVMKRTVELPDVCPKCERNFVKDGGLNAEHGPPEAGESFLECISLWCICGQNLIDNNQVETGG